MKTTESDLSVKKFIWIGQCKASKENDLYCHLNLPYELKNMMKNIGHSEEEDMRKESEGGCKAL